MPERTARHAARLLGIALLVITVAVGIGLGTYWINDARQSERNSVGDTSPTDRLSVIATVEKVDPAQYTATVRVWAVPRGAFTADDGETANRDIQLLSSGFNDGTLTIKKGRRIAAQAIPVELHRGEITHYPFDRYGADVYFSAVSDGKNGPLDVVVENNDPFFTMRATADSDAVEPGLQLQLRRSIGTLIMAGLMFTVMWALALSVAAAAIVIGRNRLGLAGPRWHGWPQRCSRSPRSAGPRRAVPRSDRSSTTRRSYGPRRSSCAR